MHMKEIIGLISLSSLTPPPLIVVSVPNQESEWSCICVLEVSVFGNVPSVWHLFAFLFLIQTVFPACPYSFGQCTVLNNDEWEQPLIFLEWGDFWLQRCEKVNNLIILIEERLVKIEDKISVVLAKAYNLYLMWK